MEVRALQQQPPFTTKDGSTIRSILDLSNAPVSNQSLAEATLPAGGSTQRHWHQDSEEFYFLLEGRGVMEIDGLEREVGPGDAILIPAGAWHPPDHRHRAPPFPLLLRSALPARGHVL